MAKKKKAVLDTLSIGDLLILPHEEISPILAIVKEKDGDKYWFIFSDGLYEDECFDDFIYEFVMKETPLIRLIRKTHG